MDHPTATEDTYSNAIVVTWDAVSSLSEGVMGTVDPSAPAYTASGDDGGDTGASGTWSTVGDYLYPGAQKRYQYHPFNPIYC